MFETMQLPPPLAAALNKAGITEPTEVQESVIPAVTDGKDLLVSAQTGSGKTVAFALPLILRFNKPAPPSTGIRALVLVPTRELARQIHQVCRQLGSGIQVGSFSLTGGATFKEQNAALRKVPDILIATPGRLLEHLKQGSVDLNDIECLVLDEADRMLDMGFREDVLSIIEQCPAQRQTLLLSATLDHRGVTGLAKTLLHEPQTIALNEARSVPENIAQQFLLTDDDAFKEKQILALLSQAGKDPVIIFTNTIAKAERLQARLRNGERRCGLLHGNLTQDERNAVVSSLRSGKFKTLVTTDVAARGLDLPSVAMVINYDLARKGDEYVHRVGRTGRAGQAGRAISLIAANEWNLLASIQRYTGQVFERIELPGLKSSYQGPAKVRASGKAYGKKNPKKKAGGKTKTANKKPATKRPRSTPGERDGSAPMKRRKPTAD
ncbi:DEAD/DEAH box helicase [Saccharospirillum sp. MSK14-1]|uniref:DEAD/DEAH box helicase n=1 Tax=Saccharospirillum sp. MSK14-1 TaxID=1897632 RepID=UPI0018EE8D6D|nr:DEAD/DEAH box helicase [Saccharospirillum sp. MSK14-1]